MSAPDPSKPSGPIKGRVKQKPSTSLHAVREEWLGEFTCRTEAGREIRVMGFRFMSAEMTAGGLRERPGAIGWKTTRGEPVRQLDHDLYEIISSGDLLERVT